MINKNASSTNCYPFNQIQHILVINKLNVAPIDFFFCIFFLLHLEDMLQHAITKRFWLRLNLIIMKIGRENYAKILQPDWNVVATSH